MPARTCGRRNVSLRYQFLMDSLAPRKSRMGSHQLPLQIHLRDDEKMLEQGISSAVIGEIRGMSASMGTASTCLGFQTGVRDFRRDAGSWSVVDSKIIFHWIASNSGI